MTTGIGALAAAALLLPALSACQKAAPPIDTAKEAAAIQAQLDAFNAAVKAGDAERAVSFDAPDVHIYGSAPAITSASEDLTATKAQMSDPAFSLSVKADKTEVAKSGDLAIQTGTYETSATNPTTRKVDHASGHYVAGWRKDDQGRWKLAAVSLAPPEGATAAQ